MRNPIAVLLTLLLLGASAAADQVNDTFDWDAWRRLPVLEGGRNKPLDTLARETLRMISHRTSLADPETGQKLDATALYLAMLFDWQGWDRPSDPQTADSLPADPLPADPLPANPHGPNPHASDMPHPNAYSGFPKPDKWDEAPLLRVDFLQLREALGMEKDQKDISPLQLGEAKVRDPQTDSEVSFPIWAAKLRLEAERRERNGEPDLPRFETKGLELAGQLWTYEALRAGRGMPIVPIRGDELQQWASLAQLVQTGFNDQTDPTGKVREIQRQFHNARAAYLGNSPADFNRASAALIAAAAELGPKLGAYPDQETIDLEVAYNRWVPFRFAWVFTLSAFVCLLLSTAVRWKPFYIAGWATFCGGLAAMVIGFGMRIEISGRAPVTNLYESVIYSGLGMAVIGVVLEIISRRKYILAAAAAVCTVALVLADACPTILDPSLRPLPAILRNNFWLIIHVMTIMLSYSAFALALGIGNITLGYYLVGSEKREVIGSLSKFTYKTLQVGVLLLAVGTILGAIWADYAWGRFWGWDPKEVWALIALLGYLAVLHARYAGWVKDLGLAFLSVNCFALVIAAWYLVNFLAAGLHKYGFTGDGGQFYVLGAVVLQFAYTLIAAAAGRAKRDRRVPTEERPPDEPATPQTDPSAAPHRRKAA